MKLKVYHYPGCSTCKQAIKFLEAKTIAFDKTDIVDKPPSTEELESMLEILEKDGGSLKNLFNTSGVLYRELGIAEKLKNGLNRNEALKLLSKNGKLIKRPFLLVTTGRHRTGTVGFNVSKWTEILKEMNHV